MNLQQIVVPNELLETSEFKSFISSLNSFPVEGPAFASSLFPDATPGRSSSAAGKAAGQSAAGGQQAPPNTPNTTRPPSTTAEINATIKSSPPPSPQPCSSREVQYMVRWTSFVSCILKIVNIKSYF